MVADPAFSHQLLCHGCGRAYGFEGLLPRTAGCEGCGADLRCCLNCGFYEPSAYNECSEPAADRVVDKQAANFCDLFRAGTSGGTGADPVPDTNAQADLARLFKR